MWKGMKLSTTGLEISKCQEWNLSGVRIYRIRLFGKDGAQVSVPQVEPLFYDQLDILTLEGKKWQPVGWTVKLKSFCSFIMFAHALSTRFSIGHGWSRRVQCYERTVHEKRRRVSYSLFCYRPTKLREHTQLPHTDTAC